MSLRDYISAKAVPLCAAGIGGLYLVLVSCFCGIPFSLLLILLFQGYLPWNPQHFGNLSWHLAFNTAASFTTNTNWQAYSGEVTLSNFSQAMGLTVQNFVSAASGIAVLWCLIRGLTHVKKNGVGNF